MGGARVVDIWSAAYCVAKILQGLVVGQLVGC